MTSSRATRGQSLVETALILPILLLLLVMSVDFGRVFFGSVQLSNAARVGANYAATNPSATFNAGTYQALITADAKAINCALDPASPPQYTKPNGAPTVSPQVGDYATVGLTCRFDLITPMAAVVLKRSSIPVSTTATFPVRYGCIGCPPPSEPPAPTPPNHCRKLPTLTGMSVAGARLAWQSAGFSLEQFEPATGRDYETVGNAVVSNTDTSCPVGFAIFLASVVVTVVPSDDVVAGCQTVPNLIGLPVEDARQQWTGGTPAFTGAFFPSDQDSRVVTDQVTLPTASIAGVSCIPSDSSIEVTTGDAWPESPPPPCRVPNFIDTQSAAAQATWSEAKFTTTVLFDGPDRGFKVKSQTLVGGDYVGCASQLKISNKPIAN